MELQIWKHTGVGIARDQLASVMQPFHQVEGTLTRSEGGTGLGLALTASLAALHNGNLQIESKVGKGTTDVVTFPSDSVAIPKAA